MTGPVTAALPHRRAIDGLRAVAVTGVLLYHAGVAWLPGGFLGVDVFFAISGYLITSLLVAEVSETGGISLRAFWARRARRLLPAVVALLLGVSLIGLVHAHDAIGRLRGDVVAALAYVSNWWQVARGESYFDAFNRPPLLRHLWSLAVEEQLYIVVPLALAWFARRGTLRRDRLALGAFALAIASAGLLGVLWDADEPSRAWFGTDTRAAALLVGVATALALPLGRPTPRVQGRRRRALDVAGGSALLVLVAMMLAIDDRHSLLPRGGFALVGLLTAVAVVTTAHPSSRIGFALGARPLQWIGTRSYAIYLWHWPVFVLTRPRLDVDFGGARLLLVRVLLTAVLAELSWRVVEQPWRTGAVVRAWRGLRPGTRVRVGVATTSAAAVLAAALGAGLPWAPSENRPELLATVSLSPTTATTLASIPPTTTSPTTAAASPTTAAALPSAPSGAVLAVGDSVLLAARDALVQAAGGRMYVDAAVGRQVGEGLDVLQHYRDTGVFPQLSALVIHLGTNGVMTDDDFNRLATIVDGVPRVVVLNVRVPKSWEGQSNAAINGGTTRFPAMRLADWYGASAEPGAVGHDGVHPSRSGARIYSDIVVRALADAPPSTTTTTTTLPTKTTTTTTAPPPEPATTSSTIVPFSPSRR